MQILFPDTNRIFNVAEAEPIEQTVVVPLEIVEEQGTVIVHCSYSGEGQIRIWPTTYLCDRDSNHRSKLLHAESISVAPAWTMINPSRPYHFTLFFEGLPKSCSVFDLREISPLPGAFEISSIRRNPEDVYRVKII